MAANIDERRRVFVQMLFALTMGEIARQVAILVADPLGASWAAAPSYAHLFLATILVATSWVGWLKSVAPGNQLKIEQIFSWPFLVLLLDVALVIIYFIIVKGTEMPVRNDDLGAAPHIVASATNERHWFLAIFAGYFLWDVLTKAVMSTPPVESPPVDAPHVESPPANPPSFWERLFGKTLWARGWISALCLGLAVLSFFLLRNATTRWQVVLADSALLLLLLFFRALKQKVRTSVAVLVLIAFEGCLLGASYSL